MSLSGRADLPSGRRRRRPHRRENPALADPHRRDTPRLPDRPGKARHRLQRVLPPELHDRKRVGPGAPPAPMGCPDLVGSGQRRTRRVARLDAQALPDGRRHRCQFQRAGSPLRKRLPRRSAPGLHRQRRRLRLSRASIPAGRNARTARPAAHRCRRASFAREAFRPVASGDGAGSRPARRRGRDLRRGTRAHPTRKSRT